MYLVRNFSIFIFMYVYNVRVRSMIIDSERDPFTELCN